MQPQPRGPPFQPNPHFQPQPQPQLQTQPQQQQLSGQQPPYFQQQGQQPYGGAQPQPQQQGFQATPGVYPSYQPQSQPQPQPMYQQQQQQQQYQGAPAPFYSATPAAASGGIAPNLPAALRNKYRPGTVASGVPPGPTSAPPQVMQTTPIAPISQMMSVSAVPPPPSATLPPPHTAAPRSGVAPPMAGMASTPSSAAPPLLPTNPQHPQHPQHPLGPVHHAPVPTAMMGSQSIASSASTSLGVVKHVDSVFVSRTPEFVAALPRPTTHDAEHTSSIPFIDPANPSAVSSKIAELKSKQAPEWICRPSMWSVPATGTMRVGTHLPLGLIVQPLATPPAGAPQIPVVNFGSAGVIRCRNCRTYINPFVTFVDAGRMWKCNICDKLNEVPTEYFSPLDERGIRKDIASRPELTQGTVEMVATQEYTMRPPQTPSIVFVIDVSYNAVSSGMVAVVAETIKANLDSLPGGSRTLVGFVTFDCTVHFYNLKSTLTQPQCIAVPDINDPFLPLPSNMLVNVGESRAPILALLDALPNMYKDTKVESSCFGTALQGAYMIQKHVGGKLVAFTCSLPALGIAPLRNREDPRMSRTQSESAAPPSLLAPADPWYDNFAKQCGHDQISVDVFCGARSYLDISTIGSICRATTGQVYLYVNFTEVSAGWRLRKELTNVLVRETGFEAVMRTRTSKGLRLAGYYGSFTLRGNDLMQLPTIDADKTFGVRLAHDDNAVLTAPEVYVQTALLYTTSQSERRIRVITTCLPVTNDISDVYAHLDPYAIVNLFGKSIVSQVVVHNGVMSTIRDKLMQQCIDILRHFRLVTPPQLKQPSSLLLIPRLRMLPFAVMCMLKSYAFRPSMTEPGGDLKAFLLLLIANASDSDASRLLMPRLYKLYPPPQNIPTSRSAILVSLAAQQLPLSFASLVSDSTNAGVFVLDAGFVNMVWVGANAPPEAVHSVTSLSSLAGQDINSLPYAPAPTPLGTWMSSAITALTSGTWLAPQINVVVQGAANERNFTHMLYEDQTDPTASASASVSASGNLSYADFMTHVHNQVLLTRAM